VHFAFCIDALPVGGTLAGRSVPISRHRFNLSLLFALIPACALVGGLPFVNRLEPIIFGFPFLLFWILAWVVVTPVFLYLAYRAGRHGRAGTEDRGAQGPASGGGAR
jgi:hypothetical protein